MKKNYKEAIVTLIGGAGVLPILMSIFIEGLDFGYAIIIAFVFFLLSGTLNGLLVETPREPGPTVFQESQKQALMSLVGGIGVVIILLGTFSDVLSFGYSIVISYGFFLLAGVIAQLIEVEELEQSKKQYYPTAKKTLQKGDKEKVFSRTPGKCHSCGRSIERNDIFCSSCGAEQTNF
jgi:hypothetical protein